MILSSRTRSNPYEKYIRRITDDIYAFIEGLGVVPTAQHKELIDAAISGEKRIACRSGMGPGKTFTTAIIGLWRCLHNRNTKLIVTAPTMSQCKDAWLSQAKKLIKENPKVNPIIKKLFTFSETGFGIMGRKQNIWGAMLKASRDDNAARGQHEKNMLIIIEEASGVDRSMWEVYKSTLTSPKNSMIVIGNPSRRASEFFSCFYGPDKEDWCKLHWNAEETPISEYFSGEQQDKLGREYGKDSDVYRINVLGEFPKQDSDSILSDEMLAPCITDEPSFELRMSKEPVSILPDSRSYDEIMSEAIAGKEKMFLRRQEGIDYARFGGDENAVYMVQGCATIGSWMKSGVEPSAATDTGIKMAEDHMWTKANTLFVPDSSGIGQGCLGRIYENEWLAFEFHNHGKAFSKEYSGRITEAYFWVRKKVLAGKISIPDDPILIRQLTQRKYMIKEKTGQPILVPKLQHKSEFGESPDRADGFVMAHYPCPAPGGFELANF